MSSAVNVIDLYTVGGETPGDGYFTITFDFDLEAAAIEVQTLSSVEGSSWITRVKDTEWTLDTAASRMSFITTTYEPATGDQVRIARCTDRNRVLDYAPGSTLTAANLNNENDQIFFILQEIEADLDDALHKDQTGSYWDAEGLRSHNAGNATTNTGWVTFQQMIAAINAGEVVELGDVETEEFIGDGEQVEYELSITGPTVAADQLFITINGIIQHTNGDSIYQVVLVDESGYPDSFGGNPALIFTNPASAGDVIEVRLFRGTVQAIIGDLVVTGDSLADGVLEYRHFSGLHQSPRARMIFEPSATAPTFEEVDDISNFEATLDAWLASKALSDLAAPFVDGDPFSANNKKITDLAAGSAATDAVRMGQLTNRLLKGFHTQQGDLAAGVPEQINFLNAANADFLIIFIEYGGTQSVLCLVRNMGAAVAVDALPTGTVRLTPSAWTSTSVTVTSNVTCAYAMIAIDVE